VLRYLEITPVDALPIIYAQPPAARMLVFKVGDVVVGTPQRRRDALTNITIHRDIKGNALG
jgi:hypothetical protein